MKTSDRDLFLWGVLKCKLMFVVRRGWGARYPAGLEIRAPVKAGSRVRIPPPPLNLLMSATLQPQYPVEVGSVGECE